jgi:hypothetical protein
MTDIRLSISGGGGGKKKKAAFPPTTTPSGGAARFTRYQQQFSIPSSSRPRAQAAMASEEEEEDTLHHQSTDDDHVFHVSSSQHKQQPLKFMNLSLYGSGGWCWWIQPLVLTWLTVLSVFIIVHVTGAAAAAAAVSVAPRTVEVTEGNNGGGTRIVIVPFTMIPDNDTTHTMTLKLSDDGGGEVLRYEVWCRKTSSKGIESLASVRRVVLKKGDQVVIRVPSNPDMVSARCKLLLWRLEQQRFPTPPSVA